MKSYQLFPLAVILLSSLSIRIQEDPGIVGQWSATDLKGNTILIEFTPSQEYNLFVNGKNLTADVVEFGQIRYEVHRKDTKIKIELYGENGKQEFAQLIAETQSDQLRLITLTPKGDNQEEGTILLKRVF